MEHLAEQIAADGEGARKLVVIRTTGFRTVKEALRIARAVANSPLVKTAIAGSDPNWGRILAAAGYSGVVFDPARPMFVVWMHSADHGYRHEGLVRMLGQLDG